MSKTATTENKLMRRKALTLLLTMLMPLTIWAQATDITSLSDITNMAGDYRLTADVSGAGHSTIAGPFTGTLEAAIDPATDMPYRITGLDAPLFEILTGTVRNLVLDGVAISGTTSATGATGAIACDASGSARIYNVGILSGSVGGTGYTGGLVGQLIGSARVVNCYSYATITGGSSVGGIVGYNSATTTSSSINTMVTNCMLPPSRLSTAAPTYRTRATPALATSTISASKPPMCSRASTTTAPWVPRTASCSVLSSSATSSTAVASWPAGGPQAPTAKARCSSGCCCPTASAPPTLILC